MPSDSHRALYRALSEQQEALLTLLQQLVQVNSHTANVSGVETVGQLLIDALRDTQLEPTQAEGGRYAPHLCFSTHAAARGGAILLIGHHDTVFPPGTFEGFRRQGDRAFGPGVLDMKGGLSLVITVLKVLDRAGLLAALPLRFISVSDEEVGSPSSRAFLESLAQDARCALVFEAGRGGDAIITARRGSGHARVLAHGRAAHAGNALAEGRNAIWALSRFVDEAQRSNDALVGASLNVGLMAGGSARNTVPAQAECQIDLRFSDEPGQQALEAALHEAARRAEQSIPDTRVEVAVHISRRPWARTQASAELCARYGACQLAAGLQYKEAALIGGGSDANTVGALGVPTIDGLGPRGHGFHTPDEQIELSSLGAKAEALMRFLLTERGA